MTLARILLILALGALPARCGGGGDGAASADAGHDTATPDVPGHDAPPADDTAASGDAAPDAATTPPALAGTWALQEERSSIATIPVAGNVVRTTTALSLLEIAGEGTDLAGVANLCALTQDSGTELVQTIFPEALVASIVDAELPLVLAREGGAWRLTHARVVDVRGAHLEDPADEPLPTDGADPRVFDQDGDGLPGITVQITGVIDGQVWVVQRIWTELEGTVASAEAAAGALRWAEEQVVLGSDNDVLKDPVPSSPNPDPAASRFRMVRLEGPLDCATLAARQAELFPAP